MSRKRRKARKQRPRNRTAGRQRRPAPPPGRDQRVLRERILGFTYQQRFQTDLDRALRLYFGEDALQNGLPALGQARISGFQEWYIHDYVTSDRQTIIDLFADEKGPHLPAAQRQMLDDWRRVNRCHLFEVQEVEPGVGVTVLDLLSGELLSVNDVSSSNAFVKWQVVLARPLLTQGRLNFTGSMVPLSPLQKPALLDRARELWQEYQVQHPQASLDDFYRDRSLDLLRCQAEILSAPAPSHYTQEGHPLAPCTSRYTVLDPHAVEDLLDEAEEYVYAGPADDDETALAYVWVLTGRSYVPVVSLTRGVVHRSEWWSESGDVAYRSLGDLRLRRGTLELHCLSRERLQAGKALLIQIAGRWLRHVKDEHRTLDDLIESANASPSPRPVPEIPAAVDRRMREALLEEWLDAPVGAWGDVSPRQAARDPAMREELEELLKAFEYF